MFDTISLKISLLDFQSPGSSDQAQPEDGPALVMRQVWGSDVQSPSQGQMQPCHQQANAQ